MRGQLLAYDFGNDRGEIAGADGNRYSFSRANWRDGAVPATGQQLDFEPQDGQAVNIFRVAGGAAGDKNKIVAALLALFLGWLGVHKFYLGKTNAGIIMLLCGTIGWLLVLPPLIISLIAFVEFIIYLVTSDADFEARYITGNRAWF